MNQFEFLFRPLTLKGITIRNRIVMPPMNTNFAETDGSVSEQFTRYYVERGKGKVGLIIVSSAYIDPAAKKRSGALLLHDDRFIPRLKEFTSAIHATGAKVIQQINQKGVTVLLVEQNAHIALQIAHRGYVIETGHIVMEGEANRLSQDDYIKQAYLGL